MTRRRPAASALALLLACRPDVGETSGETSGETERPALPELTPAIDLDPDPSIVEVELRVREVEVELTPGTKTRALAYVDGGALEATPRHPGPLVIAERGQTVHLRLVNELPKEATTLHLHGIRLAAAHDGNPAVEGGLFPGETRTYTFVAADPGLYWYHPHLNTPSQMIQGLKGPLLVREPEAPPVAADRVIFVDAIRLSEDAATIPPHDDMELRTGRVGDRVLVNGVERPRAEARAGARERWRIVNGTNARALALRRASARPFIVIGSDGGPLPAPRSDDVLRLAAGERVDLLVDVDDEVGAIEAILADAVDHGHGLVTPEFTLVEIEAVSGEVDAPTPAEAFTRPFAAMTVDATTRRRELRLGVDEAGSLGPIYSINDESWPFNQAVVVPIGVRERWEIVNEAEGRHPFHIHGLFFQVLDGDAGDPTIGWKDTVDVAAGERVELVVRPSALGHWLFHCQIPIHAERGMMGDLIVVEAEASP